jgi:hypothetical protein
MATTERGHEELMLAAIAADGRGQRALLDGDPAAAATALGEAAGLYRASWEAAPPASYGRLIGMLKAAVIAGDAADAAAYARAALASGADSPPARYALAIAALAEGDDAAAGAAAFGMRAGSPAMVRAADAIAALVYRDARLYSAAVRAIVDDFAARDEHLTGVPIADTAVMLERFAAARAMAAGVESPLLPRG